MQGVEVNPSANYYSNSSVITSKLPHRVWFILEREMEKMMVLSSLYRTALARSCRFSSLINHNHHLLRHYSSRNFIGLPTSSASIYPNRLPFDFRLPFSMGIGNTRFLSEDVSHMPAIKDREIQNVFKDLMAASWDELPDTLIHDANKALSKNTDDKVGQEAVANVFRSAEAAEGFSGVLVSLRMEIDDSIGLSGENVKPLSDEFVNALRTAYERYTKYLEAFGPDEVYLRKKVETELGTKMIHLKMRCSGLGSEWGKVTVLGTSGLSGSYVEQRAP